MSTTFSDEVLWRHEAPEKTQMYKFMQEVNRENQLHLKVKTPAPMPSLWVDEAVTDPAK
jgi:hypothetical protein